MSTRRSSRRDSQSSASKRSASIQPSIRKGLESLVEGNESYIAKLLSLDLKKGDDENNTIEHKITEALLDCMTMNNLSAEMLLARFFDAAILSSYSIHKLNKSGKGSSSTLSARIAKEWSKPNFQSNHNKRKRSDNDACDDSLQNDVKNGSKEGDVDDDDDDDWRKPLFYWKGNLIYNTSRDQQQQQKQQLSWIGSWVSGLAVDGLPNDNEFKKNEKTNSFNLSNKGGLIAINNNSNERDNNTNSSLSTRRLEGILTDLTGQFKGSYLLDQGMGPAKYKDKSHHFAFNDSWWQCSSTNSNSDSTSGSNNDNNILLLMMSASGTTEFGNFVSMGYVKPKAAPVEGGKIETSSNHSTNNNNTQLFEVVLARRYIDDDDLRQALVVKRKKPQLLFSNSSGHKLNKAAVEKKSFWSDLLPRKM